MASYACAKCGLIGDTQPCLACGATVYDLGTELDALQFTLARRMQIRAGIGSLVGLAIGFAYAMWLSGDTFERHYDVVAAWTIGLAALGALVRPRALVALEAEVTSRARGTPAARRAPLVTLAASACWIAVQTARVHYTQASTMPLSDAARIVGKQTCSLAQTCKGTVMCIGDEIRAELLPRRARIARDVVDSCLAALDDQRRTHTACDSPAPAACTELPTSTVPQLLGEARELDRAIDGAIHDQIRKGLERR
jgi:hypothetical protein